MTFENTYSTGDILTAISILVVIIGGVFSLLQWRKQQQLKRGEYINELTEKIRTDPDIREIVYKFDYDETVWYKWSFHGCGELERKVDKTLSYFSYICYLKKMKLLSDDEFKFFEYEIHRILRNRQIKNYLYNLYHFASKEKSAFTFYYLLLYGKENKYYNEKKQQYFYYIDNEFDNINSHYYPCYLNFRKEDK